MYNIYSNTILLSGVKYVKFNLKEKNFYSFNKKYDFILTDFPRNTPQIAFYDKLAKNIELLNFGENKNLGITQGNLRNSQSIYGNINNNNNINSINYTKYSYINPPNNSNDLNNYNNNYIINNIGLTNYNNSIGNINTKNYINYSKNNLANVSPLRKTENIKKTTNPPFNGSRNPNYRNTTANNNINMNKNTHKYNESILSGKDISKSEDKKLMNENNSDKITKKPKKNNLTILSKTPERIKQNRPMIIQEEYNKLYNNLYPINQGIINTNSNLMTPRIVHHPVNYPSYFHYQ